MAVPGIIIKKTRVPTLVIVEKGGNYIRYVGKLLTNHIVMSRNLSMGEVECFRRSPSAFIKLWDKMVEDSGPDEPLNAA